MPVFGIHLKFIINLILSNNLSIDSFPLIKTLLNITEIMVSTITIENNIMANLDMFSVFIAMSNYYLHSNRLKILKTAMYLFSDHFLSLLLCY